MKKGIKKKRGIVGGPSGAAIDAAEVFAVPPEMVKEFIAITVRYRELVEHRDGLGELYKGCEAWRRRQKDLDRNVFKSFMVQSFARVFNEELAKLKLELTEIDGKIKALGVLTPPDPGDERKAAGSSSLN